MKKLLLLALILIAGWQHYQKPARISNQEAVFSEPNFEREVQLISHTPRFSCDGRRYCSQMTSRAEAKFFNDNCPDTKMDGDHDGIPCENDSRF